MAKTRYFENFPIINYNSQNVVDITERVIFQNTTIKNPYICYPYDLTENERAYQFANRYYKDDYKTWILYLVNKKYDPYYDWYISNEEFVGYIEKKYGSVELALQKVTYYENNWYNDDDIDVPTYDALPYTLVDYWVPNYNEYTQIMSYSRRQSDDTINTNGIRSYAVSTNTFIKDEIVNIVYGPNNYGNGQVLAVSNNTLFIQHIIGNTVANVTSNSYIYGQESLTNTSFTNPTVVCDNLLPEEDVYWSPVTYWQYEVNKNENNKTIQVLDSDFAANAAIQLKNLLK